MSDTSPLFVSALELIAQAAEIFALKNPQKYKFVILHLANAIELILKDCMIDQSMSIYHANSPKTLEIWKCFDQLEAKGIKIAERPVIELLVDDRNTIQHRFGHPSAESAYYYIENVVSFFQRFLNDHYNIQLSEALKPHLSKENLKLLGLINDEPGYLDTLNKLADISIESAILQAYSFIERELVIYLAPLFSVTSTTPNVIIWMNKDLTLLLTDLKQKGYINNDSYASLQRLRQVRNLVAHNPENTSDEDVHQAFDMAKNLIIGLQNAKNAGYVFNPTTVNIDSE